MQAMNIKVLRSIVGKIKRVRITNEIIKEGGIKYLLTVRRGTTTMFWACKESEQSKDTEKGIRIKM
jgi:hypothetical protein